MIESKTVGQRLASAIGRIGKTQTEVGKWIGVSPQAVNGWISGKSSMKIEDAAIAAQGKGQRRDVAPASDASTIEA